MKPDKSASARNTLSGVPALPLLLMALTVSLMIAGCGSSRPHSLTTHFSPYTPEQQSMWNEASNAKYRLQPGDRFRVIFKYQPELNQTNVPVLPDGEVTLAGIEGVYAQGLTIDQLDSLLTLQYSKEYLNPDLSIIMESFGARRVYVLGQVRSPGLKDLPQTGGGILQAIALAGGFGDDALTSDVLLIRVTDKGFLYRHVDLSHLEKRPLQGADVLDIQPYDIIYVPRTTIGDFAHFSQQALGGILRFTSIFWDVYAVTHLDKINTINR